MPTALKLLKWISAGAVALILLVAFAAVWIVYHPETLLSESALHFGARLAARSGIDVRWKSVKSGAESLALLEKRFLLDFSGFCVGNSGTSFSGCAERAQLDFVVDFSGREPKITEIRILALSGVNATVRAEESASDGTSPAGGPRVSSGFVESVVPDVIERARLGLVSIEFSELRIISGESVTKGGAALRRAGEADWELRLTNVENEFFTQGRLDVRLSNPSRTWKGNWRAIGDANGILKDGGAASMRLDARQTGLRTLDLDFDGSYAENRKRLYSRGRLKLAEEELQLESFSGRIDNLIPGIAGLEFRQCRFRSVPGSFKADCPMSVRPGSTPKVAGLSPFAFPVMPKVRVQAELKTGFPPAPGSAAEGWVSLELEPASTGYFTASAKVRARIAGVPRDFPNRWHLEADVDANVRLLEFQKLARGLRGTSWAVPAPFEALGGEAEFSVSGRASLDLGRIPLQFRTELKSSGQKFNVNANGALSFEKGRPPHLTLAAELSDVRLVLPRLALRAPPRFFPDTRIQREKRTEKVGAPTALTYLIQLRTPEGAPVRLVSNLSKTPIPMNVELSFSDSAGMRGRIRLEDFPLKLFRRKAAVQRITILFDPARAKTPVDGVLRVSYADYKVKVLLLGTLEEPVIQLISDPPLPERQLLSVLLFGRPLEDLDPLQSESVGSARAALADSALNLASLYLFASTPIESFGYDPTSGLFSAKVRLSEGTSLNFGAEAGELSQIGIRRRLTRFWTITTTLGTGSQDGDSSVMAFLEWVNRY